MLSTEELLKVARAYAQATGMSLTTIGRWSCNNDKIYKRIAAGGSAALSRSIETAAAWFHNNWPENARWPDEVPRPPGGATRAAPRRPRSTASKALQA
jgi:hypothetical protein